MCGRRVGCLEVCAGSGRDLKREVRGARLVNKLMPAMVATLPPRCHCSPVPTPWDLLERRPRLLIGTFCLCSYELWTSWTLDSTPPRCNSGPLRFTLCDDSPLAGSDGAVLVPKENNPLAACLNAQAPHHHRLSGALLRCYHHLLIRRRVRDGLLLLSRRIDRHLPGPRQTLCLLILTPTHPCERHVHSLISLAIKLKSRC
ncbi:hypothetical protein KC19_VG292700 [Ceratodon purpureus]|uniref:Uncharacterized protein n=1 Tax=Ceratodon purpureus TaxID=3225 RepID=A0A8T0HUS9_CERPU|nr:hypothetical protein KC19_VG292700 [Ceratodon purpureus]